MQGDGYEERWGEVDGRGEEMRSDRVQVYG